MIKDFVNKEYIQMSDFIPFCISKKPALDDKLSLEAKGFYYVMTALPHNFKFTAKNISKLLDMDIKEVDKLIDELVDRKHLFLKVTTTKIKGV